MGMAIAQQAKIHRVHGRSYEINGRLPGRLFDPHNLRDLPARATDVSPRGLGLICDVPLSSGRVVWLILADGYLALEVVSCQDERTGMYRVGTILKNSDQSLESVFAAHACLNFVPKE